MLTVESTSTCPGPPFGVTLAAHTDPVRVRQIASTLPTPAVTTVGSLASPPVPTSWTPYQPYAEERSLHRLPAASRHTTPTVPSAVATAFGLPWTRPELSGVAPDQLPVKVLTQSWPSTPFQMTSISPGPWLTAVGAEPRASPVCSSCGVSHDSEPKYALWD